MISPEIRAEMRRLVLRLHWRIETVARRFGVHHSTVRHALESGPGSGEVAQGSILDPYKPFLPSIVSKEARVRLDANTYSVPPQYVGKTVHVRADASTVRILHEGTEVARHTRSWERHQAIEEPAHLEKLLERRKAAQKPKQKDRFMALSPEARLYIQEVARSRIRLDHELTKLSRLVELYGEADVAQGMAKALAQRTFGARYVRALIDQGRFAAGLTEPPEPILTGNAAADSLEVQPHALESYDELVSQKPTPQPGQ